MNNKYVVIENSLGLECIVIFPQFIKHQDIRVREATYISAGFVDIATGMCYGESISTGLKSRPKLDTILARKFLQLEES